MITLDTCKFYQNLHDLTSSLHEIVIFCLFFHFMIFFVHFLVFSAC